jgi:carboxy-terminal domain RNA polymerase II polypeptide A small phosphatase
MTTKFKSSCSPSNAGAIADKPLCMCDSTHMHLRTSYIILSVCMYRKTGRFISLSALLKEHELTLAGVFVVERPALKDFLKQISLLGELSIFTAGLPEYALPILAAIDPEGVFFGDRIVCRGGTSAAPEYPCVKDLSRLGRNLSRTLIIDDTPLAFLWQPANGVPVLGFRGDPDDNLLLGAVLPLLQLAADEEDVRPFLNKRFGMATWFTSHGYVTHAPHVSRSERPGGANGTSVPRLPAAACPEARAAVAADILRRSGLGLNRGGVLLLCDFDKTLIDFDVTERVTEKLAIELRPALQNFDAPADFVPVMNAMLREMEMRDIRYPALIAALRELGKEVEGELASTLRAAQARGITRRIISNCNSLFLDNVLEVQFCQILLLLPLEVLVAVYQLTSAL